MKKLRFSLLLGLSSAAFLISACDKSECHECHYENAQGAEVELGEFCDDELEELEANGKDVNGTNYDVHCHEH